MQKNSMHSGKMQKNAMHSGPKMRKSSSNLANKVPAQEFTLEADSELRFEIETPNVKVTVEVRKDNNSYTRIRLVENV